MTEYRVQPPGERLMRWFNEDQYLLANPDVADAVKAGLSGSGRQHYQIYGYVENRSFGLPTRRDRLLRGLDITNMRGIEIGALMTPTVVKSEGNIDYIDHADTVSLRKKYEGDINVDPTKIVPVDIVWTGGALSDVLKPGFKCDYIIASHVIEHVPDMISWLSYLAAVLAPSGAIRLAVPDRRFTFDVIRYETRLSDLLDAYVQGAVVPTPHAVLDHCANFRHVDLRAAWLGTQEVALLQRLFFPHQYMPLAQRAMMGEYLDVHCWVYTPISFAAAMEGLCELKLTNLACSDFYFPQPFENEFIIGMVLEKNTDVAKESWKLMRETAEKLDR